MSNGPWVGTNKVRALFWIGGVESGELESQIPDPRIPGSQSQEVCRRGSLSAGAWVWVCTVGRIVGCWVVGSKVWVGEKVGTVVGNVVGTTVEAVVGAVVGSEVVGGKVGNGVVVWNVGLSEGLKVGLNVGLSLGLNVGLSVGFGVGDGVKMPIGIGGNVPVVGPKVVGPKVGKPVGGDVVVSEEIGVGSIVTVGEGVLIGGKG